VAFRSRRISSLEAGGLRPSRSRLRKMGALLEADARCACRRTLLTLSTDNSVYPAAALFTIVPSTDVWRALVVQDWEPNIYVVDDDEAVRDSLRVLLEAHGMVVEDYGSSEAFARGYVPGRKGLPDPRPSSSWG
jgi:hypothetical protein